MIIYFKKKKNSFSRLDCYLSLYVNFREYVNKIQEYFVSKFL